MEFELKFFTVTLEFFKLFETKEAFGVEEIVFKSIIEVFVKKREEFMDETIILAFYELNVKL